MFELGQPGEPAGIGVLLMGAKQTGVTPAGLGPAAMYSLSWLGTLPLRVLSGSLVKTTVPSPGWRGSPFPPQIGGGVEPGAAPAEAVIVRAADDVARVGRIDGDARLVLGEAAVVEVQTDVVPLAAQPLDRVLVALIQRPRPVAWDAGLGTL